MGYGFAQMVCSNLLFFQVVRDISRFSLLAEDEHTALGRTLLPQTLTSLLKAAIEGGFKTPDDIRAAAILELLRVGANLCMDHGMYYHYFFSVLINY